MSRFWLLAALWAALLGLGFGVVFVAGGGLPTEEQTLEAALHPAPPVDEAAAIRSADTIVRLRYGELAGGERSVDRRTDFGIDHWVITYVDRANAILSGVEISVGVTTGVVEVASFP